MFNDSKEILSFITISPLSTEKRIPSLVKINWKDNQIIYTEFSIIGLNDKEICSIFSERPSFSLTKIAPTKTIFFEIDNGIKDIKLRVFNSFNGSRDWIESEANLMKDRLILPEIVKIEFQNGDYQLICKIRNKHIFYNFKLGGFFE